MGRFECWNGWAIKINVHARFVLSQLPVCLVEAAVDISCQHWEHSTSSTCPSLLLWLRASYSTTGASYLHQGDSSPGISEIEGFHSLLSICEGKSHKLNIPISSYFFRTILRCILHGFPGISKKIDCQGPILECTKKKNHPLLSILSFLSLFLFPPLCYLITSPKYLYREHSLYFRTASGDSQTNISIVLKKTTDVHCNTGSSSVYMYIMSEI